MAVNRRGSSHGSPLIRGAIAVALAARQTGVTSRQLASALWIRQRVAIRLLMRLTVAGVLYAEHAPKRSERPRGAYRGRTWFLDRDFRPRSAPGDPRKLPGHSRFSHLDKS